MKFNNKTQYKFFNKLNKKFRRFTSAHLNKLLVKADKNNNVEDYSDIQDVIDFRKQVLAIKPISKPIKKKIIKDVEKVLDKADTSIYKKSDTLSVTYEVFVLDDSSDPDMGDGHLVRAKSFIINVSDLDTSDMMQSLIDYYNKFIHEVPASAIVWSRSIIEYELVLYNKGSGNLLKMPCRNNKTLNCVHELLLKNYCKGSVKNTIQKDTILKLGNKDGVTADEIYEFCLNYKIKLIIYDFKMTIIKSNFVKSNKRKALIIKIYNNHVVEIKKKILNKKVVESKLELKFCANLQKELIDNLDKNIETTKIEWVNSTLYSFIADNVLYHNNADYTDCLEILTIYGLQDHMNTQITFSTIGNLLKKLFFTENTNSFFPITDQTSCGYNFLNVKLFEKLNIPNDVVTDARIKTIDHNKNVAYCLRNLEYLITVDLRAVELLTGDCEIVDDRIYTVEPETSSILLPQRCKVTGGFLQFCAEQGELFNIIDSVAVKLIPNHYTKMIDSLYQKLSPAHFKKIYTRVIGNMQTNQLVKTDILKLNKICNTDELLCTDGYTINCGDKYACVMDKSSYVKNMYSEQPIRMQIWEESRKIVYNKCVEMGLNSKTNLLQIKTDSITYFDTDNKKVLGMGLKMGDWKTDKTIFMYNDPEFYENEINLKLPQIDNDITRVLTTDYAGSGKTHYIINNLIPKIGNNYMVVTPSHACITDYKKNNITNSNVIQKYCFKTTEPTDDIIIVDEIGMCNKQGQDFILRCALLGKGIFSFGDYNQLDPVQESSLKSENYLNMLYNTRKSLGTNERNNFTNDYYDALITLPTSITIYEVQKHNTLDYTSADTIICYTNETRQKYNQLMLDHLGLKLGDEKSKVVCRSNELRESGIFNNFYYTVKSNDGDTVTLNDGVSDTSILYKLFIKYFEAGYCRTLYNIQGQSVISFHYPEEDMQYLLRNDESSKKAVYTLISRLKTKRI